MSRYLFIAILILCGSPALAEEGGRSLDRDGYSIHYQVFHSTFLAPDIAAAYQVVRARNRSVVMVSVRRGDTIDSDPQRALVAGTQSDLIHTNKLQFRELEQRGAIYYLAEFQHGREETHRFRLQVQPGGGNRPRYPIEFSQQVHWEE